MLAPRRLPTAMKHALASAAWRCGLTRRPARDGRAVVLAYHRVTAQRDRRPGMSVHPDTFEQQVGFLASAYRVLPAAQVAEAISTGRPLPQGAACITFDDGWRDNYTEAWPILQRAGLTAEIYVVTGHVGTDRLLWTYAIPNGLDPHRAGALKRLPSKERAVALGNTAAATKAGERVFLSWDEMAEMLAGGVSFGAHTHTHPILTNEPPDVVDAELAACRRALMHGLGVEPLGFAYPNGDHNQAVRAAVRTAGFRYAWAASGGRCGPTSDPYAIYRLVVHEGAVRAANGRPSLAVFALMLSPLARLLPSL